LCTYYPYYFFKVTEKILIECDQIYHMACPASPVHYQHNAIKTLKTNVLGTLNMCGLARRTGARILLASTSEVYGDPDIHPQTEDYNGIIELQVRIRNGLRLDSYPYE
jgi:UDP-glucuronate decarboxylase